MPAPSAKSGAQTGAAPAAEAGAPRRVSFEPPATAAAPSLLTSRSMQPAFVKECGEDGTISLGLCASPLQLPASRTVPDALVSLAKVRPLELPAPPACFLCPIGAQLMQDPVTAADGSSYERERISALIANGQTTSPTTGQPLSSTELRDNAALKAAIEGYAALRREVERQWQELEQQVTHCMWQASQGMRSREQHLRDLRGQVLVKEAACAKAAASASTSSPVADSPLDGGPERQSGEGSPKKQCTFGAGRAPRPPSASGERGTTPTPRQTPRATSTGRSALDRLRVALTPRRTPRLTPRLANMLPGARRRSASRADASS